VGDPDKVGQNASLRGMTRDDLDQRFAAGREQVTGAHQAIPGPATVQKHAPMAQVLTTSVRILFWGYNPSLALP